MTLIGRQEPLDEHDDQELVELSEGRLLLERCPTYAHSASAAMRTRERAYSFERRDGTPDEGAASDEES